MRPIITLLNGHMLAHVQTVTDDAQGVALATKIRLEGITLMFHGQPARHIPPALIADIGFYRVCYG